jgi:glycosyltransferase involved in cell wall biosynthesis
VPRPLNSPPKKNFGFQTDPPILLFVGRLQNRKRIDSLIRICSRLPEEILPELWIVGDGPILQELKDYAQNIYPRTKFWGGQYGEKLDEIFKTADLFVMPGTGGLAIQQAMSFGLPVIVAEGDGTQSNMVFPENGWTITPNNEEVLYSTVVKALSDPEKLLEMGRHAYETIKNQANIDVMADVFIKTIHYVNRLKNNDD